jgi:hypothetical protein
MSLSSHITELRKKHEALDKRIESEKRSPASDDLTITALKREKLHIKEEITRLSSPMQ